MRLVKTHGSLNEIFALDASPELRRQRAGRLDRRVGSDDHELVAVHTA